MPVLVCARFSDHSLHSRGSFEVFRRAGSAQRWLYAHRDGKGSHYYGDEASRTRLQFFDRVLKGEDNGWAERPPVRLAVHESGPTPVAVTHETAWPPPDLTWTTLHLDATTRTLTEKVPPAGSVSFRTRRDAVTFDWTVPEDLDVIGPMAARLYVELPDGGDVTLFVGVRKLRDGVEPTFEGSFGFAYDMVTKGWQRAAHRELDQELSTPWQPVHTHRVAEPLRPGEIVPVDVALRPQATRFRAGEVLRLEVRGRWFYPRDPVRGQLPTGYRTGPGTTCAVYSDEVRISRLLLSLRSVQQY